MHRLLARRRLLLLKLAGAVLVTALPTAAAHAAGLVFPENGVRSIGRGGAVVAQGDDISTMGINPAQLAKHKGWQFDLQINIHHAPSSFTCTGLPNCINSDGTKASTVSNSGGIKLGNLGPVVGASTDFGLKRWTFGLAVIAPPGVGNRAYPATGPQRYDIINVDFRIIQILLGAAVAPIPQLRIGATFIWSYGSIDTQVAAKAVTGNAGGRFQYLGGDLVSTLSASQVIAPGGDIGVAWDVFPWLEVASAVRLPLYLNLQGTGKIDQVMPDGTTVNQSLSDNHITFRTNVPPIVRFGARYKYLREAAPGEVRKPRWDIELDFFYEPWHLHDSISVDFVDAKGKAETLTALNSAVPPIKKYEGFTDAWNLRLGGDVHVIPDFFSLRAGAFYEKGAIPNALKQVGFFSDDQIGVGGGFSFFVKGFEIFASYMHIFIPDRFVAPGQADGRRNEVPVAPGLTIDRTQGRAINAGLYQASYNLFGVGVRAVLDDILRSRRTVASN
jgi:long-chain fatty acid transport protein